MLFFHSNILTIHAITGAILHLFRDLPALHCPDLDRLADEAKADITIFDMADAPRCA